MQVASALHNAAEGLGPVHVSWMAPAPAPSEAAQAGQGAAQSGRKLLGVQVAGAPAAGPSLGAYSLPAAPAGSVSAAAAPYAQPLVTSLAQKRASARATAAKSNKHVATSPQVCTRWASCNACARALLKCRWGIQ